MRKFKSNQWRCRGTLEKQHRNQAWFRDSGKWNSEFMERNWEIYAENRNGLYDGNYKEFLEEYNGKENLTGLYRLMDPVYTDSKSITGVKLDFIW